jgi:hypothetical protein
MKKLIFFALFSLPIFGFSQKSDSSFSTSQKKTLDEGTLVKAALKYDIRGGDLKVGDQLEFELAQPLMSNNDVVVQTGAKILGTVTEARGNGVLGRKGKLAFSIDYLYLSNGQVIKLRGQSVKNINGSGAVVAATAVLVTPLGLLIPGKSAKFKAGTQFDAYIDKAVELR